jgi:hypothetical protein
VGGLPATPRVALEATPKLEYRMASCFRAAEEHRCSRVTEAPRGEPGRLERLEQRAPETRRRWNRSEEPKFLDE